MTVINLTQNLHNLSPEQKRALLAKLVRQSSYEPKTSPLSYAQQRLWFLDQLAPGNPFYNQHLALRLPFPPDIATMERALNEIVRRHETLRTTFRAIDGEPQQVIAPQLRIPLKVLDLRSHSTQEREARAVQLATDEARQPFNLVEGPLLRTTLLQMGEQDCVFLLSMHHIICDGWSITVFFNEFQAIFTAYSMGQESPLPEPKLQYADYAVWQRQWLQQGALSEQLGYWKQQLRDLPQLHLPTDFPRPPVQSFRGAYQFIKFPEKLTAALKIMSQREGVTLFMTLLVAFKILLHRYTGAEDVVVGAPVASRSRAELEGMIGFFVNTLVMRTDLSGDPTVREALRRVREVSLSAYAHQDVPFEKLVEELHPERDLSRNPLFQVTFQLFKSPVSAEQLPNGSPQSLTIQKGTAAIDLAIDLFEGPEGLSGCIEYSTDLFSEETIKRMLTHYERLLESMLARPLSRLSELPLLTTTEEAELLIEFNRTASEYPRHLCVHQLFEAQVERAPDARAVVYDDISLSYRELNRLANRLARRIREMGVGSESLVAVAMERSPEIVIALLATLKAGAAYLPLDVEYPEQRLRWMIEDARPQVLIVQQRQRERFQQSAALVLAIEDVIGTLGNRDGNSSEPEMRTAEEQNLENINSAENLAYVIYTSGSTGVPKGVMVSHGALNNHMHWMQAALPLAQNDRTLLKSSSGFDVAILEALSPLLNGARLIIARPGGQLESAYLVKLMVEQGVTVIDLVPSLLQVLLDEEGFKECRTLRRVICGGEALPVELHERFFAVMQTELHNLYGPTEAAIGSTAYTCQRGNVLRSVPIGRPVANVQLYILDAKLNPVPVGFSGELHIAGEGLARCYLNRPALSAEKFIPNPFSKEQGARLYRTGDLARYLPDGNIEFLGRIDQQVKVRGFRIELGEIEARLKEQSYVRDAVVLIRGDEGLHRKPDGGSNVQNGDEPLLRELSNLFEEESEQLLADLDSLSEDEAGFLLAFERDGDERRNKMIRRLPDFEFFLRIRDGNFIQPPRASQRNWILQRAVDEFTDDLKHLDHLSKRFVVGSERAPIKAEWSESKAQYDDSQLIIEGQQVMQDWERPLMQEMAKIVAETHGDVLEVGFGMGISATYIQERGVRSHTIIESNTDVAAAFQKWRSQYPERDIRLVLGTWQDVIGQLCEKSFDGVFFDAYPLSEDEFESAVIESITFAESFFPAASALLRDGGIFTYYTNEIDSFSRRHQRLLFKYFSSYTLSVVKSLAPPEDCNYWWADSMAVVKAIK